jgi:hypothetical protein
MAGCTSSTERRAVQVVQTATRSADAVLDGYAAASVLGRLSQDDESKVKDLDQKYRQAKAVARAAVIAYKSGQSNGDTDLKQATDSLQAAITAIISLPPSP